ncbi:aldo/keto reductase [Amnibacterium kyonggiense]|nr:aldo/keto reductase [Amnibacterium kyonggiense]
MTQHRTRTGLAVPELGFGTAQFGNLFRETSDEDSAAAVESAWESGIRYFDTAPHYGLGLSERRLGAALAGLPRDEYVLSTKVGKLLVEDANGVSRMDDEGFVVETTLRRRWDYSRDGVLRSLEGSLERLGVDRVDIVYLHDPDDHWAEASTTGFAALAELRDQGVVGAIGAGMNQSAMLARFVRETDVDLVMCAGRYTLLEQGAEDDLLPAALERGVGVVAAGVYNSGLLSRPRPPADAQYDYADAPAEMLDRANRIADVCEAHGLTLPEVATVFARRHPAVVSTVLGLRTPEQVAGAIDRFAVEVPDALWRDLESAGLLRRTAAAES